MNMRPLFETLPEPPMNIPTCSTAGSFSTISPSACWCFIMAAGEASCPASDMPVSRPISCCGKKPFGMITNRQSDCGEEYTERCKAKPQHDIEAALVSPQQSVEGAFAQHVETSVARFLRGPEKTRRHHWGQRQRHEGRYYDGH